MKTVQESNLIQDSEEKEDRKIGCMLHVVQGDISDQMTLRRVPWSGDRAIRIDTIVNAAKPTLMGSDKGVDGAIHRKIDELLKRKAEAERSLVKTFNDMICEEIDVKDGLGAVAGPSGRIRCRRGQAVITKGYGLCDYVIHVVGSIFDGEKIEAGECLQDQRKKFKTCSSSRVRTLESCYREIVRVIREHPDIKNVAVPIISSGTYGFPFEMAADIAIATIGNALLEWQQEDGEYFNDTREGLQNIFFFICPRDEEKFEIVSGILAQYSQIFDSGNQVVAQNSLLSQKQYINEIKRYDKKRGYFCIARTAVLIGIAFVHGGQTEPGLLKYLLIFILGYNLADTITYLISLILMADIQKPSANVIRSMLLLLLNYVEVSIETACLYLLHYGTGRMSFLQALQPGLMGEIPEGLKLCSLGDYLLYYGNTAVKFFFITMAFGYLAGHLRQRTFRRQNVA